MHLNEIHLLTSRATDNSQNTNTLKTKNHNIKRHLQFKSRSMLGL